MHRGTYAEEPICVEILLSNAQASKYEAKRKKSSILFNAPGERSAKTSVHFEKEGPKVSFGHTLACMAVSFSERSFVLNLQPFFSSKNDLSKK